jgi:hypothetical protein
VLNDHDVGRLQIPVKNAPLVRRLQRLRDLARQPECFIRLERTAQRVPLEVFQDQVIGTDVVDLTDVRMVDGGDGARSI